MPGAVNTGKAVNTGTGTWEMGFLASMCPLASVSKGPLRQWSQVHIPQAVLPGCLDSYVIVFSVTLPARLSLYLSLWSFNLVALCRLTLTPGE